MHMPTRRASTTLLCAALLFLVSCGGDGPEGSNDDVTTSSTATVPDTKTCRAAAAGYSISYPADWHTNSGEVDEPCHWFDAKPVALRPATDVVDVAVHVQLVDARLREHVQRVTSSPASEVLRREDRSVGEHPAVAVETKATEQALVPKGTRIYSYLIDAGRRVLQGTTREADADARTSYEKAKDVLDAMMESVVFFEPAARCSADGLSAVPEPQRELPQPVAATRAAIVDAAVDCDFARLAALASQGTRPFTASFGGTADAAEHWQQAESSGQEPLRYLVGLLNRPFAGRDAGASTQYVWPSAYAYEGWEAVPAAERQALEPLYDDADFRDFARFGSYTGYRVGVAADGEWQFFVAGD